MGLGGQEAYLTRLDAVDEEGGWVPLTPPSAHDALKGRMERTENKNKDLGSEREGPNPELTTPAQPHALRKETPTAPQTEGGGRQRSCLWKCNHPARWCQVDLSSSSPSPPPPRYQTFQRDEGVILESILNVVMSVIWFWA